MISTSQHVLNIGRKLLLALLVAITSFPALLLAEELSRDELKILSEVPPSIRIGRDDAPSRLAIFFDPTCRYCEEFTHEMLPRLFHEYVVRGALQIEFYDHPMSRTGIAPLYLNGVYCAYQASRASVSHPENFFKYLKLVSKAKSDGVVNLPLLGEHAALDMPRYEACLEKAEHFKRANSHKNLVEVLEIVGTPYFILSNRRVQGLISYEEMKGYIESDLKVYDLAHQP